MSQAARLNKQHGRRKGSDADHLTARVGRDQRGQGRLRWLGAGKRKEGRDAKAQASSRRLYGNLTSAATSALKPHVRLPVCAETAAQSGGYRCKKIE